jgi:hypothetical protein
MKPEEFLERIEAALIALDLAPSTFGRKAIGDPKLVFDLRNNDRELRYSTQARILDFIDDAKRARRQRRAAQ